MEERIYIGLLLDYYGGLLTENQRVALHLYYMEDLTLAEVGESMGITRQGVRDAMKRGKNSLHKAERQVGMVRRYRLFLEKLEVLKDCLERQGDLDSVRILCEIQAIWEGE